MRFFVLVALALIAIQPSTAQIEFVSGNFFPAELEFEELHRVTSEISSSDIRRVPDTENAALITDVGFDQYARRTYAAGDSGSVSIEILTLMDYRAAYSILTLLRSSPVRRGPPGDAFAQAPGSLIFSHGKRWVRIQGRNVSDGLIQRLAASVSNRMGEPQQTFPSLISHFPETGFDASSLRYFPGFKSYATFNRKSAEGTAIVPGDMEIAEARYSLQNGSGTLSLLKFPTHQIAEDYFTGLSDTPDSNRQKGVYLRRIGPLLCILEGSFNSVQAGDILAPVQYSYSVQWIFDKNARSSTVWGIPVSILNSAVWSFFFVFLLCVSSILAGAVLAGFRLLLRRFFPNNPLDDPERTEITRLRLP
jgi:hypothetical protein